MYIGRHGLITIITHPRKLIFALVEQSTPINGEAHYQLLVWFDPYICQRTLLESEIAPQSHLLGEVETILKRGLNEFHKRLKNPGSLESLAMLSGENQQQIKKEDLLTEELLGQILTDLLNDEAAITYDYLPPAT